MKDAITIVSIVFTCSMLVGVALIGAFYGIKQLIKYLKSKL